MIAFPHIVVMALIAITVSVFANRAPAEPMLLSFGLSLFIIIEGVRAWL